MFAILFSLYPLPDHEVAKNGNDHILKLILMTFSKVCLTYQYISEEENFSLQE